MIYDVVIVGGGPVALFLSCELRLAGVTVLVLETGRLRLGHRWPTQLRRHRSDDTLARQALKKSKAQRSDN
nr:FAD-dependent monooxygenase [Alloacidobacterium dinghuense]